MAVAIVILLYTSNYVHEIICKVHAYACGLFEQILNIGYSLSIVRISCMCNMPIGRILISKKASLMNDISHVLAMKDNIA